MVNRLAQCFVAIVVASALALSLAYGVGYPQTWWFELARYVPYPVYALPAVAAVGVSLWLGWYWRWAALLGLGLVVTLVMGLALGKADEGSGQFRLMTYNIKYYLASKQPGGFDRLAWEVMQHDPDVIVMQDADDGGVTPREARSRHLRTMVGTRQTYHFGQYVVASRFPMKDCKQGSMPFRGEPHSYVQCTVVVAGTEIDLVTAHFISPREGLNAARRDRLEGVDDWAQNFRDRLTQAHKLAGDLAGHPRPVIVAGDLNSLESSPIIRSLLDIGLRDAFSSAGLGYGYTHGHALRTGFSFLRIDHILVSPTLGVRDCFVGGQDASEHRPVIADLLVYRD